MKLCKHDEYTTITKVLEPKWSTKEILLSKQTVDDAKEHLVIRFAKDSAFKEYGWFYMSRKKVRRHRTQKNGRGEVYVVPLREREEFIGKKYCEHMNAELF